MVWVVVTLILIAGIAFLFYIQVKLYRPPKTSLDRFKDTIRLFFSHLIGDEMGISEDAFAEALIKARSVNDIAKRIQSLPGVIMGSHRLEPGIDQSLELPMLLSEYYRLRHMYIIGGSGSGKTNLIQHMILQDIEQGRGVALLNPEVETVTEKIMPFIPESRIGDVIYVDPTDGTQPISLNPLHHDDDENIDVKVAELTGILGQLLDEKLPARMDEILSNALYTLMLLPETTLLDLDPLLDPGSGYQREYWIGKLTDERLIRFWRNTYPKFPSDAYLPIVYRVNRFLRSEYMRNVLCHPGPALNFRTIIDDGKILLFNVADGIIGNRDSKILGQIIVAKLQLAAMSRQNIPEKDRVPFYLYLDEFQSYASVAASSYELILSRARKYRLGLILAHQNLDQVKPLLSSIMANTAIKIGMQIQEPQDAARLSRSFTQITPEQFSNLHIGQAYCQVRNNSWLITVPYMASSGNQQRKHKIIERSRVVWGIRPQERRKETNSADDKNEITPGDGSLFEDRPEDVF